jgi:hypothetical protein
MVVRTERENERRTSNSKLGGGEKAKRRRSREIISEST